MAIKKTILTVDLYDNVLTEKPGDYSGKIRITGTFRNKEVSTGITDDRSEYRPETIENILGMSDDKKLQALAEGKCISDGLGHLFLNIGGSFPGKKTDYKSPDNKIGVTFIPSAALMKLLENIYVNADIATVGPMIEHITDSTTGAVDSILTPSAPAIINGSTLLLKGTDPSVGVYFTPENGGEPVKVALVVTNTTSQIIVSIPALADGNYYLSVTTQAGAGYSMVKEPRTYRLPVLLTVGDPGGEEERPGEL